jgi:polysaccharide biosynthesis protein PslG
MRGKIGVAGLLTAVVMVLPVASAQAVGRSFWGVVDSSSPSAQDFDQIRDSRAGVVRIPLFQKQPEILPGVIDWSSTDQMIGGLASRGIAVLPTLIPNLADYAPPISGSAAQAWVQFAHDAVARYGRGGSYWSGPLAPYHVQFGLGAPIKPVPAWQVGNEPSLPKYWPTNSKVKDYARLLKITHDAIRGVDPNATIVLAGLPGAVVKAPWRGWSFLNRLYGVPGAKQHFDVAAFHAYAHKLDDIPPQMKKFRGVMKSHGDGSTMIWITEFGYGSDPPNGRLNRGLSGQANMLRKAYELFLERRKRWNLRGVIWYEWRDPGAEVPNCSFCSSAGLLFSDSQPKPAYSAFEHFTGARP